MRSLGRLRAAELLVGLAALGALAFAARELVDPSPSMALGALVHARAGALVAGARFPGPQSRHGYGFSWPGGRGRVEWDWRLPGPHGGSRELLDLYPASARLSTEAASAELTTFWGVHPNGKIDGYPSYTRVAPCELDDDAGSYGYGATVYGFDRHGMVELELWGAAFNRATAVEAAASLTIGQGRTP